MLWRLLPIYFAAFLATFGSDLAHRPLCRSGPFRLLVSTALSAASFAAHLCFSVYRFHFCSDGCGRFVCRLHLHFMLPAARFLRRLPLQLMSPFLPFATHVAQVIPLPIWPILHSFAVQWTVFPCLALVPHVAASFAHLTGFPHLLLIFTFIATHVALSICFLIANPGTFPSPFSFPFSWPSLYWETARQVHSV
jgi:hypothetical protein